MTSQDKKVVRIKTDNELRRIIQRIAEKHYMNLVSLTRNIQLSVDVELDERDNLIYTELNEVENKIRAIKGVVINDIFYRGG
jgi:hypothetical protein